MPERLPSRPGEERGVSEVLGYVFVFSLVVASVGVVTVGGFSSLADVSTAKQVENSQKAFDVLYENMAELYTENAPSRATEISLGNSELFYGKNVTVNVTVVGGGSATPIVYETRPLVQRLEDDRKIIYEGGAVFRTTRQAGVVVREPLFTFRSNSVHVTIPALSTGAGRSVGGSTALVRARVTGRTVEASDTRGNFDKVVVNITSPRYERWETYLSDQPGITSGDCSVTPSENRVECTRDSNLDTVYVVAHETDLSLVR